MLTRQIRALLIGAVSLLAFSHQAARADEQKLMGHRSMAMLQEMEDARLQCEEIYLSSQGSTSTAAMMSSASSGPCQLITVMCLPDSDWGNSPQFAFCRFDKCRLILRESTCNTLGLRHLDIFAPGMLKPALKNRNPQSYLEIMQICITMHEIRHTEDSLPVRSCETEKNAFEEQRSCFEEMYKKRCHGENSLPPQDCQNLQDEICFARQAAAYNGCLCSQIGSNPSVGRQSCATCKAQCSRDILSCATADSGNALYQGCDAIDAIYCDQQFPTPSVTPTPGPAASPTPGRPKATPTPREKRGASSKMVSH